MSKQQSSRPIFKRRRAQSLAEFAFTLPLFLLAFVMILEVSRIMWAYITVNHAARMATRYATTGEVDPRFQGEDNIDAGWDPASNNPLERILPCRPIMYKPGQPDPLFDGLAADQFDNQSLLEMQEFYTSEPEFGGQRLDPERSKLYQPFRSGRECSVEQAAISQMITLPLDPGALRDDPGFYEITMIGYSDDVSPTEGDFMLEDGSSVSYETYYDAPEFEGEGRESAYCFPVDNPPLSEAECREQAPDRIWLNYNQGSARGFAGEPSGNVQVLITYNLPLITPLLNGAFPYIRVDGVASLTNEAFGNTGLNREAIRPPIIPDVPVVEDFEGDIPDIVGSTTDVPYTLSPTEGAVVERAVPTFEWVGLESAVAYRIEVYQFADGENSSGDADYTFLRASSGWMFGEDFECVRQAYPGVPEDPNLVGSGIPPLVCRSSGGDMELPIDEDVESIFAWRVQAFARGAPWGDDADLSRWSFNRFPKDGPDSSDRYIDFELVIPELTRPEQYWPLSERMSNLTEIDDLTPVYTWQDVSAATDYFVRIWTNDGSGWTLIYQSWYDSALTCGFNEDTSRNECNIQPNLRYVNDMRYGWEVYPYNPSLGPNDTSQQVSALLRYLRREGLVARRGPNPDNPAETWIPVFRMNAPVGSDTPPNQTVLVDPGISTSDEFVAERDVDFQWWESDGSGGLASALSASYYRLLVFDASRNVLVYDQWLSIDSQGLNCNLTEQICTYTIEGIDEGVYLWNVFGWTESGGNGQPADVPGDALGASFRVDLGDSSLAPEQPLLYLPGASNVDDGGSCTGTDEQIAECELAYLIDENFSGYYTTNDSLTDGVNFARFDSMTNDPSQPIFVWPFQNAGAGDPREATHYYVYVKNDDVDEVVWSSWFDVETGAVSNDPANRLDDNTLVCEYDALVCYVRSLEPLGVGTYSWWVRPYNDEGYGPWSNAHRFEIDSSLSGLDRPDWINPTGGDELSVSDSITVRFNSADAATTATHYEFDLGSLTNPFYTGALAVSNPLLDCSGGECATTQTIPLSALTPGEQVWRVRGLADVNGDGDFGDAVDEASAWATITFTVTGSGATPFEIAVNVGAVGQGACASTVNFEGVSWQPLQNYEGSNTWGLDTSYGNPNQQTPNTTSITYYPTSGGSQQLPPGSAGHDLFSCRIYDRSRYAFEVPENSSDRSFLITLGFAEQFGGSGYRRFDIVFFGSNGSTIVELPGSAVLSADTTLTNYDIAADIGANNAAFRSYSVQLPAQYDVLYIGFEPGSSNNPIVQAIRIESQ